MSSPKSSELTINWTRSIWIDTVIDEDLVKRLTPKILLLRQESDEPITVGIDSPGGSLSSLDTLLGLLTGPSQTASSGRIVTVATNKAYSAAANFLAFGTYSVAYRHAQVLYHDVRWGGMEDVTPEKARNAAKSLQDANDAFSLRLANRIIKRLIWTYIDISSEFENIQKKFPITHKKFKTIVSAFAQEKVEGGHSADVASFATYIYAKLSSQNDYLIKNVMDRLARWINFTKLAETAPTYRNKGSRVGGLLDGAQHLHKLLKGSPEHFKSSEKDLKLLLSLLVAEISSIKGQKVNFMQALEDSSREFSLLQSMNDSKHFKSATSLMLEHEDIFFGRKIKEELKGKSEQEQYVILSAAAPYAQLFWHFCVLICRELFEGEHVLKPNDAQLLGLIDEVAGGGPIQSRREFRVAQEKKGDGIAL